MRKVLCTLALVGITGCTWPQWVQANIKEEPVTPELRSLVRDLGGDPNRSAYAIGVVTNTNEVAIDRDCSGDGICLDNLGDDEFWAAHEDGHLVTKWLHFPLGDSVVQQEYSANVVACLSSGRQPNFVVPEQGYRYCEKGDMDRIRKLMKSQLGIDL